MTPRKPGSIWSAVNKAHVALLEAAGLLAEPGRALIEAAKADGSWSFLDDVEALVVPDDLAAALAEAGQLQAAWDATQGSVRKRGLYWVKTAKTKATRDARILTMVERISSGAPPI
jgi:uncharacterized protein YdeI (YjbR/CyaY-like superfamily)